MFQVDLDHVPGWLDYVPGWLDYVPGSLDYRINVSPRYLWRSERIVLFFYRFFIMRVFNLNSWRKYDIKQLYEKNVFFLRHQCFSERKVLFLVSIMFLHGSNNVSQKPWIRGFAPPLFLWNRGRWTARRREERCVCTLCVPIHCILYITSLRYFMLSSRSIHYG